MIIWFITGLWIALGCAQLAHIITLFTDRSLQTYTALSCVLVFVGIFLYVGILFLCRKKMFFAEKNALSKAAPAHLEKASIPYIVVFLALATASIYSMCVNYVPELTEGTYDIVVGNLQSGNIMMVHPFTGESLELGMPLRRQVIGLTSLYSGMAHLFSVSEYVVLCKIVPICLWCFSMLLYWAFAQKLFLEQAKRWLFLCAVALFYLLSRGGAGMPAAGLFGAGFTGETIRSVLLIPYTFYVTWHKKWLLAIIAVLVEVSIVWTTYGIGYCAFIVVCMFLVHFFLGRRAKHAARVE